MAERRWPLTGRAVELLPECERAARKKGGDVDVRMLRHQTAFVFNDVASTGPALDRDVAQARGGTHVDAVERVRHAPEVVRERLVVVDNPELARLHIDEC